MHAQVMSNNNGSVDKEIQEAVTDSELIHAANHAHAKSIKEKNKKLVQMEEDNKKLKVKLAKSEEDNKKLKVELAKSEEDNKKLKVTHKEQVSARSSM